MQLGVQFSAQHTYNSVTTVADSASSSKTEQPAAILPMHNHCITHVAHLTIARAEGRCELLGLVRAASADRSPAAHL